MFKVVHEGDDKHVINPLWALSFIKSVKLHGSPQDSSTVPFEETISSKKCWYVTLETPGLMLIFGVACYCTARILGAGGIRLLPFLNRRNIFSGWKNCLIV